MFRKKTVKKDVLVGGKLTRVTYKRMGGSLVPVTEMRDVMGRTFSIPKRFGMHGPAVMQPDALPTLGSGRRRHTSRVNVMDEIGRSLARM